MCNAAIEAPIHFILIFSMMCDGIVPSPGSNTIPLLDRHNVVITLKYYQIPSMLLSSILMFSGLQESWKHFHSDVKFGFMLLFPSFCFLLMACALITATTNEYVLCLLAVVLLIINWITIAKTYRSISVGKGLLSVGLSLIFPICFLPSTLSTFNHRQNSNSNSDESVCQKCSTTMKSSTSVKSSTTTKNQNLVCPFCSRTFFCLMIAKKCFLLVLLFTLFTLFK